MPPPSRVLHPRLFHAPACEQKRCHETDDEEVATKKKVLKQQRFLKAYNEKWNCLVRSTKGDTYVFCTLCHADFSCAHGGRSDCAKHISSKSHDNLEKLSKGTPSIMTAFSAQTSKSAGDLSLQITNAEAMMCQLVADANLSLSMADRLVPMFKEMFPDSKIAQGMQCGRTKATIMIKEMSALAMKNLADQMKMRPFSIATDGSNEWYRKQFPLVIRTFSKDADGKLEKVTTQLLALRDCEGSATGENIFCLVDGELKAQGVPWTNCVAFGSDNAAVMTGQHKGVFSFVLKKNSKVYLAACTLHLVHIGAKKGASCLPPIEEILLDIYYFFRKSTLRQSNLMELQELYDVTQRKMLKHGCTRWLSIARCIKRLLENWEPLKQLFHEEYKKKTEEEEKKKGHKKSTAAADSHSLGGAGKTASTDDEEHSIGVSTKKIETISTFLRSPTNKLYTMFLSYTLNVYDGVLVKLQAEEPLIHELHTSLVKLITNLFNRFLKPVTVFGKNITDVEFQLRQNQKENKDLLVGDSARELLDHPDKYHLRPDRINKFYDSVRKYFEATCSYLLKKLPLNDQLLKHVILVDPSKQLTASQDDLRFFLKRFPALLPAGTTTEMIEEQFASYQVTDITDCKDDTDRVDETWVAISNRHPELKSLCEVMLGVCTIPHSSAACERIFSCVRKTSTDQRTSLNQDTVESLLVLKSKPDRAHTKNKLHQLRSAYTKCQQKYKH